jgi:hypothetical protein
VILEIFFPKKKKIAKKFAFLIKTKENYEKVIIILVFDKNAYFLPKIGKNYDHNIHPSAGLFFSL